MNALHNLLIVATLSLLSYAYLYLQKTKRVREMLKVFPSPPTMPLLGNLHLILGSGRDRVKKFLTLFENYESPFVVWLFYMPVVILTKPEDIQLVSTKCVDRDVMGILTESVGDGIVVARADKWKRTRRFINPAFGSFMLRQYLNVFNEQSRILVRKLEKEAKRAKVFDMWPYTANANIDIITENITGSKLETQENLGNEFSEALITTLKMESLRFVLPVLLSPTLFYLYRLMTGNKNLFERLHKLPKTVLAQKKLEKLTSKPASDIDSDDENRPKTLIDILFRLHHTNPEFTEQQMHDEMLNFIATGSESTAVIGSFVLLILAIYPDAQEKVYNEVSEAFRPEDENIEMATLQKLKYTEQCVKETLRIFTLFPIALRKTNEDITLSDNRVIPADCQVGMALEGIHLNSELYPEPRKWNPDNFSDEAVNRRPKNSFLAFGFGPRACIGSRYAMMSLKTQVAHIVRRYRLSTNIKFTDLRPVMDAIIRNKFGYPVKLEIRDQSSTLSLPPRKEDQTWDCSVR